MRKSLHTLSCFFSILCFNFLVRFVLISVRLLFGATNRTYFFQFSQLMEMNEHFWGFHIWEIREKFPWEIFFCVDFLLVSLPKKNIISSHLSFGQFKRKEKLSWNLLRVFILLAKVEVGFLCRKNLKFDINWCELSQVKKKFSDPRAVNF